MPDNTGVVVAALTDGGFEEVGLVKVVGLSIQQDDGLLSGIAEFGGEKD